MCYRDALADVVCQGSEMKQGGVTAETLTALVSTEARAEPKEVSTVSPVGEVSKVSRSVIA